MSRSGGPHSPSPSGETQPLEEHRRSDHVSPTIDDGTRLDTVEVTAYEIDREVARGGMGRVLAARDTLLCRRVAIKRLIDDSPAARARFLRETQLTARLQHPGIVPVYQAGRLPSSEPYYTMRLVEGTSLAEVAKNRALAGRLELLPNLQAAADAVAYAHAHGIIHRDLKPANILVGDFGETLVIDWGLAKDLRAADGGIDEALGPSPESLELTSTGSVLGTVGYMSPEQATGRQVDERVDVYALGAMLYWLLSAERPGEALDVHALARRERRVPRDLVAIVAKATAADPATRYPTARALAEDLRRYLAGQLVASHDYTAGELARRWFDKNRKLVAVAALALLAVVVFGVASLARILA